MTHAVQHELMLDRIRQDQAADMSTLSKDEERRHEVISIELV